MNRCFACGADVLNVAMWAETLLVNPTPDPAGNIEVRQWHRGWDARRRYGRPARPGWVTHQIHQCGQVAA